MTVIAIKDGIMAADSFVFADGTKWPGGFPKITRGQRGLIGVAGSTCDCWLIARWWANGGEGAVDGLLQGDDGISALLLLNDGSALFMDSRLVPYPVCLPGRPMATGEQSAATFVEGAMYAGASAEQAVRLATQYCKSASGEVQVEQLKVGQLQVGL